MNQCVILKKYNSSLPVTQKTKMSPKIIEQLAPKGVLRVAINLSNFLLVTDRSAEGNPAGVSPDMAAEVARRLGVGIEYVEYKTPGESTERPRDERV